MVLASMDSNPNVDGRQHGEDENINANALGTTSNTTLPVAAVRPTSVSASASGFATASEARPGSGDTCPTVSSFIIEADLQSLSSSYSTVPLTDRKYGVYC
ncbi:hypothetical protein BJ165DRAFT_1006840 [Panaeolus papilionaceus]|nr:hypothetical protein BJ165DRAFT_1006840 [Panaeolus papilionaceus]